MKKLLPILLLSLCTALSFGQQPQTGSPDPQALQGINSKWTNGVGPGYWPYQKTGTCTGLNICISPGTVPQCMGASHVTYAGTSSFALTNNATNYVYLDLDASCVPTVNTVGYSNRNIAIAKIVTVSGAVTSLSDDRFWGSSQVVMGAVNAQTGGSYTILSTDRDKLITLSNAGAIAVTLPTTLGASFVVAVQNIGAGTATLTPSSGTINGASNVALTGGTGSTGQGAWLFFDGTNWAAVMGGGSGGGGGGSAIKECIVTTGDPDSSSPLLVNGNDSPAQCGNDFGADLTITAVAAYVDAGTTTVTPILTGGSGTSILTGALTTSAGTWVAGTVNGSPTIHAFSSNGATCSSTPCTLDSNITAAGATRYLVVKYTAVTTGGTTTPIAMGTCANHQPCYNNAGTLGGIAPGTVGQSVTSVGTSSTPVFSGCHLSNGVNAQTTGYTLLAADDGALITFTGTSLTATLPNPPPNTTWCASVMNLSSSTNLTVSRNSLTINTGTTNLTLAPYQSTIVWTDGTNYFATVPLSTTSTSTASQSASVGSAHNIAVPLQCTDASGSGTAQTCTTSPTFTPAAKDCIYYTPGTTNTGALTLNVNSSSTAPVQKWLSTALASGDAPAGKTQTACYDGTNWQVMTIGNTPSGSGCAAGVNQPGTCLLEEHTASSSATLDFTTCISSTYDEYLITFTSLVNATNAQDLLLLVGTGAGPTYQTSGYEYLLWNGNAFGSFSASGTGASTTSSIKLFPLADNSSTYGQSGRIYLHAPQNTSLFKSLDFTILARYQGDSHEYRQEGAAWWQGTTALTAIRFEYASGNITSGIGRCYGLVK